MPQRIKLVNYGPVYATPDMAKALERLEKKAREFNWVLRFSQPDRDTGLPESLSLREAGREVAIEVFKEDKTPLDNFHRVGTSWALAVPLGFTPWNRYPLPGADDMVFHYLGPWQALMDRLHAEGRGEIAWPSVCCAAQCDVGKWNNTRALECFVQAQLHRVGVNCGAIDGRIGERTVAAFRTLGIHGKTLQEIAEYLKDLGDVRLAKGGQETLGHILLPGREFSISAVGSIGVVRSAERATLSVKGPGRVVLDISGE